MTFDLDICFDPNLANAEALAKTLANQNARLRDGSSKVPFCPDAQRLRDAATTPLETENGNVTLFAQPKGVENFQRLWERAVVMDMGGFSVRVASIPDLIAMKQAANRPKDREHIMQLQTLLKVQQEQPYCGGYNTG